MIFTGKNRKPIVIVPLLQVPKVPSPSVRSIVKYNMFDAVKPTNCGYCGSNK